jgi:septation ring formation regulator EzrA
MNNGWQGRKTGRNQASNQSGVEKSLADLRAIQARARRDLAECQKKLQEIEARLSKFGIPHQSFLPYFERALKLQAVNHKTKQSLSHENATIYR